MNNPLFKSLKQSCMRRQECYSCDVYCRKRHTENFLGSALPQRDQTIRVREVFLFLRFCKLSRVNQHLLLHQEKSLHRIVERERT